jgi:serine/threonine protein kinase
MVRSRFKLPAEGSPFSGTTRVLAVDVTPGRADDVAEVLRELIERLPEHPGILPIMDAGVTADGRFFIVTPPGAGQPLDEAIGEYGPAALADALPRLRILAEALDCSAQRGLCHGALTPTDILVSPEQTRVTGIGVAEALSQAGIQRSLSETYSAPEVRAGGALTPAADQYSLAVIAWEWLFGLPLTHASAVRERSLPGVERASFAGVFERATAADHRQRFSDCATLVSEIAACVSEARFPEESEEGLVADTPREHRELPLYDVTDTRLPAPVVVTHIARRGVSGAGVAAALVIGATLGAIGMWWLAARPDSVSPVLPDEPVNGAAAAPAPATTAREVTESEINAPREDRISNASLATPSADPSQATQLDAGVLVHSIPAGATVAIDGVPRGTTPVAVRGLELGTRTVVVSQSGYRTVERQVALTDDRPSRTLEVELAPVRAATTSARAVAEGSVIFETRPAGATVFVDGRAIGVTPLTVALAPGSHGVRLERSGYRPVTTGVVVRAGERTRVAARLEGGSDQE